MRNLPLLLLSLLCICGPAPSCQAQVPDTVITVTKLPYPEARIFAPPVREGLAPSRDTMGYPNYESCIQTRHTRLREADLATLTTPAYLPPSAEIRMATSVPVLPLLYPSA